MKKIVSVLAILIVFILHFTIVIAESAEQIKIIDEVQAYFDQAAETKEISDEETEETKQIAEAQVFQYTKNIEDDNKALSESDQVEIENNTCAVLTVEGIGIAYEITDDGIYIFTQDYMKQSELFGRFYKNPLDAVSSFIKKGIHLNIYDERNKVDIFVEVSSRDWTSIYPDLESVTDDEAAFLLAYIGRSNYADASYATVGIAGSNRYLYYDCHESDGRIYLITSIGGYQVRVYYQANDKEDISRGLELLDGLTIVSLK